MYLGDKIEEERDGCACSMHEIRKYINILVRNPRGNIRFWRSKNKWEDSTQMNIKIDNKVRTDPFK
jgi:hypothetical protein